MNLEIAELDVKEAPQEVKITIVSDYLEDGLPRVAGFLNNKETGISQPYSDFDERLAFLISQLEFPTHEVIFDRATHKFVKSEKPKIYWWRSFFNRAASEPEQSYNFYWWHYYNFLLSINDYRADESRYSYRGITTFVPKLCLGTERGPLYNGLEVPSDSESSIIVLKYSPYHLTQNRYSNGLDIRYVPWKNNYQNEDSEDDEYYTSYRQFIEVNIYNVDLYETVFVNYLREEDRYVIDNRGQYMLVYRKIPYWLEFYDISQKKRLFKIKSIPTEDNLRDVIIEIDPHNGYLKIFYENLGYSYEYRVFNFQGELIYSNDDLRFYIPSHSIQYGNLILLSGELFQHYFPQSNEILKQTQYGLFLRDPLTLEFWSALWISNEYQNKVSLENSYEKDLAISPNGQNFTLTEENKIHYFRIFLTEE